MRIPNVVLTVVLVAATGCVRSGERDGRNARTPPDDDVAMGRTGFDPRAFLCELTGGPAGPRRLPNAGRRYTPAERAKARLQISTALIRFGLAPQGQPYRWHPDLCTALGSFVGYDQPCSGMNLYAELPATVPSNAWIVVGSHYDTVKTSPGADDDGSGTTAALMVAEALSGLKKRGMNLMFVFFDQEEEGLIGSDVFADHAQETGRAIVAAHCLDMVGWDKDRDRAVEIGHGEESDGGTGMFGRLYGNAARRMTRGVPPFPLVGTIRHTDMGRSDHESFIAKGVPAVLISEEFKGGDTTPHYHGPKDTCDTIDIGYLRMVAMLVATAVAEQLR